ncbi:MAG: 30S ribosomal protein S12 methylthiotransferase RimO [Armatimonadetes bacterium]|nr:30S ribosomal protein S12 methylthiotransferase RimO [Armatimonadota bacterium]MDE2207270.1 30S ribosomal protein S12 methylthiotransferase RimO [Armatimonadota bacterium]
MARIRLINLGCAKNEVDAEEILGLMEAAGHAATPADDVSSIEGDCDTLVINTCAFIRAAQQQSVDTILEAIEKKKRGEVGRVVVAGCLAQRYARDLAAELPEVDAFVGTGQMQAAAAAAEPTLIRLDAIAGVPELPHHRWLDVPTRRRIGAPWSAWLKISEGCDHACTFCAIPSFRGKHQSKPFEVIVQEAASLAESGAREINLIAQDTTQYGYDRYGKPRLPELLQELGRIHQIRWIRIFYAYPSRVTAAFIHAMATVPNVCHYLDMPLQHADDAVLKAMRRPLSYQRNLALVARLRAAVPDIALRTTVIVGFPGETLEQFSTLERFVEEAAFDHAGVFEYSVEEGTPAAMLRPRVPAREKHRRRSAIMRLQQTISLRRNQALVGSEVEVLIEAIDAANPSCRIGRTWRDAPEVDGSALVTGCTAAPGTFVRVRVTEAGPYDIRCAALPHRADSAAACAAA